MIKPEVELVPAVSDDTDVNPGNSTISISQASAGFPTAWSKWEARQNLARHRAETERLRVLVDFLARPVHAHGGAEPDPDIVTAYNLAVEAALVGIRRAVQGAGGE